MWPYVIIVGCVRVPGVPVLLKSGHGRQILKRFLSVLSINVN
jgi:hypothetical protein